MIIQCCTHWEFERLLKYFPTSYERRKYVEARIASLLRNYLDGIKDAEKIYQKHLNTKLSKQGTDLAKVFQNVELVKYQTILEKLQEMLKDENQYNEHQWQEEILQIILLLYPKYILLLSQFNTSKIGRWNKNKQRFSFGGSMDMLMLWNKETFTRMPLWLKVFIVKVYSS